MLTQYYSEMYRIINLIPFSLRKHYLMNNLSDVSILIKTLERKTQLINQLQSLLNLKFNGQIIIADDSKTPYGEEIVKLFPSLKITYLPMHYDSGTSAGRNIMLEHTTTPYFVLCDDDFIFEPRTQIPMMKKMLIENDLDILGGVFMEYRQIVKWIKDKPLTKWDNLRYRIFRKLLTYNIVLPPTYRFEYCAHFTIEGKVCSMSKVKYSEPFTRCDLIHNFFIARTEPIKKFGGWNPILKGGEHQNFFIRAKLNNLKVATTRKFGIIHDRWTPNSDEYRSLRNRGNYYHQYALQEFGLVKMANQEEVFGAKFPDQILEGNPD